MITNVGSLGLDDAYVPLVPYSRVLPTLLAVGRGHAAAARRRGQVRPVMVSVNAAFDHGIVDGFHAATMSKVLRAWMEHPYEHFDRLEAAPPVSGAIGNGGRGPPASLEDRWPRVSPGAAPRKRKVVDSVAPLR